MSRPITKRTNYLKDTITVSRIIAATQLDDERDEGWKKNILALGQKLILLLNEQGSAAGGSEKEGTKKTE